MKASIYVSDENVPLYEEAKAKLGDSVSAVFARCLKRELDAQKVRTERIVVEIIDTETERSSKKAFHGRWIVGSASTGEQFQDGNDESLWGIYSVAQTKENRIAVFQWGTDSLWSGQIVYFRLHEDFDDFADEEYPEPLIQTIGDDLGHEIIEELDI